MTRTLSVVTAAALLAFPGSFASAQDEAQQIEWSAQTIDHAAIVVPAEDRPTLLLFVMAEQPQSAQAMEQVSALIKPEANVQVLAVVSGEAAALKAHAVAEKNQWRFPIVADPTFAASGTMHVHAWPTTLVVKSDGTKVVHIPGLPVSYARDVEAYLAFAAGELDAQQLEQALAAQQNVRGQPQHAAHRYLHIAERLIEMDQYEMARQQLAKGLELAPDDPQLKLAMADVLLVRAQPAEALELLEGMAGEGGMSGRIGTLRGRALFAFGRDDEAATVLSDALQLNPEPSVAHYLLARLHERAGRCREAAEHYRAAFEHSTTGRELGAREKRD